MAQNKKGLTLPGYNYLGPFNSLFNGKPTNKADEAARKHDLAYSDLIKQGQIPYLFFNKADQSLLDELQSDNSFGGNLARAFFHTKKTIATVLGGGKTHSKNFQSSAAKERAAKRKLYFARSNKGAKQQKMDSTEPAVEENNEQQESATEPRTNGGAGSGGGGGSAHGVGVSTGGWSGGCYFSDRCVITTVTRQWYAPIYNGHLYKSFSSPTDNKKQWRGISTPWGYFNFNYYASHFSPQDWQRLINEYKAWRPVKMHVKIYNLQIKQIVTLGADTLYNNDLTAGVHIFCDGSHQFPYAQHPWDEDNLPELPNSIYKLPQYAYYQRPIGLSNATQNKVATNTTGALEVNAPLYMLEHASHEVLRTGEQTSFNFTFDCGWVHNDRSYAPPQANFNPLVRTRRHFTVWNNTASSYSVTRYDPYNKPSNWMPGPGIFPAGYRHTAENPQQARGPIVTIYQPPGSRTANGTLTNNGTDVYQPSQQDIKDQGYSSTPVNGACNGLDPNYLHAVAQDAGDNNIPGREIDIDMERWGSVWTADGAGTEEQFQEQDGIWLYPNQAWNDPPLTRTNPIWDKVPRSDRTSMLASSDGTLPMHHPPGTIFVKVAKIPIPTSNNTDSYLNLYVTGQVTCQIIWETERYQTKNWRPEIRNTAYGNARETFNMNENGVYSYSTTNAENMPTKMGINRVP